MKLTVSFHGQNEHFSRTAQPVGGGDGVSYSLEPLGVHPRLRVEGLERDYAGVAGSLLVELAPLSFTIVSLGDGGEQRLHLRLDEQTGLGQILVPSLFPDGKHLVPEAPGWIACPTKPGQIVIPLRSDD